VRVLYRYPSLLGLRYGVSSNRGHQMIHALVIHPKRPNGFVFSYADERYMLDVITHTVM